MQYCMVTFMLLSQKRLKESLDFQNARKDQLITMINKDKEQLDTIQVSLLNKLDECRTEACVVLQATLQQLACSPCPTRGRILG